MVVINNIDRNHNKEIKRIENINEGELFEFENDLYIKGAHTHIFINISQGKECVLNNELVYKVKSCNIDYSLVREI